MAKWFVIADDLTGAAEVAGIAYQSGYSVKFFTSGSGDGNAKEDVVVVNADTRNQSPEDAAGKVRNILLHGGFRDDMRLFMKTDSLLRGNAGSELLAALSASPYTSCLLIPANPSKQRTIRHGQYYVGNALLSETEYRHDPEHPRIHSEVAKMVATGSGQLDTMDIDWEHSRGKVLLPDISSAGDLRTLINTRVTHEVMPAGGADYFHELLTAMGPAKINTARPRLEYPVKKCIVFGSYANANRKALDTLDRKKYSIYEIPLPGKKNQVSQEHANPGSFFDRETGNKIVLRLQDRYIDDVEVQEKMLQKLVELAAVLAASSKEPVHFLVTGGRTAALFCEKMNWNQLLVVDVPGNGTTTLKPMDEEHFLTVKPGSYEWPDFILK